MNQKRMSSGIVLVSVILSIFFIFPVAGCETSETGPVPQEGASPTPSMPTTRSPPDYSSPFCVFNDLYFNRTSGQISMERALELGNHGTRLLVPWYAVEPTDGVFDFTLMDGLVNSHHDVMIKQLWTIQCKSEWGTRAPGGPEVKDSSPPLDYTKYERFVTTVVDRYKGKVAYWQIENEVLDNTLYDSPFWNGTKEEYIDMLKTAYSAIKAADPEALVVLSGFQHGLFKVIDDGDTDAKMLFEYFMEQGRNHFDVVDFHQYFKHDSVYSIVRHIKDAMKKFGYEKPMICTESGDLDLRLFGEHLSHLEEPIPVIQELLEVENVTNFILQILPEGLTEEEWIDLGIFLKTDTGSRPILERYQAENLVKRIALTLSQGVDQIYFIGIQDLPKENAPDWFWPQMGMCDLDGRRKPHFYTYQLIIDRLVGITKVEDIPIGQDKKMVRFSLENSAPVYILWSNDTTTVDLTDHMLSDKVGISHIVTELAATNAPIRPDDEIVATGVVPVGVTPIIVQEPDVKLRIEPSDIILSSFTPVAGDQVTVNATVHNLGTAGIRGVMVSFSVDGIELANITLNIPGGSSFVASFGWTSLEGAYDIGMEVDPGGVFFEPDRSDNNASIQVNVMPRNERPILTPFPPDPTQIINETESMNFTVGVSDEDAVNSTYEWTLDGIPAWNRSYYVYNPDLDDSGSHYLNVTVTDSGLPPLAATFQWEITVLDVQHPPTIVSCSPPGLWWVQEAEEGFVNFTIQALDPDGDELSFGWFVDDVQVGMGHEPFYLFFINYTSAGVYNITVVMDDGTYTVPYTWIIHVNNTNRAPKFEGFHPSDDLVVELNSSITFNVSVLDPDGFDTLGFKWYVDDQPVDGVNTDHFTYKPTDSTTGTVEIRVDITDMGDEHLLHIWMLTVVADDASDGDDDDTDSDEDGDGDGGDGDGDGDDGDHHDDSGEEGDEGSNQGGKSSRTLWRVAAILAVIIVVVIILFFMLMGKKKAVPPGDVVYPAREEEMQRYDADTSVDNQGYSARHENFAPLPKQK